MADVVRVGVVGIEHPHVFEMIDGLVGVGAATVCHAADDGPLTELYEGWRADSQRRDVADVLADDSLDLIVLAGVPAERAGVAVAALGAGRHVFAAKPAVTTLEDLDRVDAAAAKHDRRWWVFFSERLANRAVIEAVRLVRAGAIGDLLTVTGSAPHLLNAGSRPEWFFDRARTGGILTDLATHQIDQFLALAGSGSVEVTAAAVANLANADHPGLQDYGRLSVRHTGDDGQGGRIALGDHRVDWLSPAGLGTWGDVRLFVTGTAGTIEVRSNIDVMGESGGEHLLMVGDEGAVRVDCRGVELDWPARLVADVRDGTDTFVPHDHTVSVCRIAVHAQWHAEMT